MYIREFDWDERNVGHIARHGVSVSEVEEAILFSRPLYRRGKEGRYVTYAATEEGRYLFVVFGVGGRGRARVITARDMTEKERGYFKRRKGVR